MVLQRRRCFPAATAEGGALKAAAEEEEAGTKAGGPVEEKATAATAAAAGDYQHQQQQEQQQQRPKERSSHAATAAAAAAGEGASGHQLCCSSTLKTLCLSFGFGALFGLLVLCVLFVGVHLLSGRSNMHARFRELRAFSGLNAKSKAHEAVHTPERIVKKEVFVKNLPATVLETTRGEQVFPGADSEHLHGVVGVDLSGDPLWIPAPHPGQQSPEQLEEAYAGYCFNTALSDSLSLDREVPTFDSPACAAKREEFNETYPYAATAAAVVDPRASVIIVFHNENLSVLLRSIHSVLNRSPPLLLREVILVNDHSNPNTHPWLFERLEKYVSLGLPKTKLITLKQRRGLMGARAAGAAAAGGSVLVFLDSHVEVLPFWLEPLLQRIQQSPLTAGLPRVASVEAETFEIVNGGIDTLAFNWSLGHMHRDDEIKARANNRTKKEGDPIESPIMPGGIFAISRNWWNTLGGYDEGLRLYAGEEFELSFKVWMCGGKLEVLTCSKVAHIFRSDKYWKGQVYEVPGEEIARNKQRAAHVWMDDYVAYVLLTTPPVDEEFLGDLTAQKALRKRLNCHSFQWYLDNVYPELQAPSLETAKTGAIVRRDLNGCLDTMQKERGTLGAFPCHFAHGTQAFLFDGSTGRLFVGQKGFNSCVAGDFQSSSVLQLKCTDTSAAAAAAAAEATISLNWKYLETTKQLQLVVPPTAAAAAAAGGKAAAEEEEEEQNEEEKDPAPAAAAPADTSEEKGKRNLCLQIYSFPAESSPFAVELTPCDPLDPAQRLEFLLLLPLPLSSLPLLESLQQQQEDRTTINPRNISSYCKSRTSSNSESEQRQQQQQEQQQRLLMLK
ncbi:hypothetical protein Efla_007168 [Eimeria flavescens]